MLRRKRGRELHKSQLLALCRVWRYKSNTWKPKAGRPRKRSPGAAAAAAPTQVTLPPPRCALTLPLDSFSLGGCLGAEVTPHLALSSSSFAGPVARAHTLSTSQAGFTAFSLREYAAMETIFRKLHMECRQAGGAQAALSQLPLVKARWSQPAHLVLPLCGQDALQVSALMERVQSMLSSGHRILHTQKQRASASGKPLEAALAASHADWSGGVEAGLAGFARAYAFLACQRASAPLSTYLETAVLMAEELTKYSEAVACAFAARYVWSKDALDGGAVPLQSATYIFFPERTDNVPGHGPLPALAAAIMTSTVKTPSLAEV